MCKELFVQITLTWASIASLSDEVTGGLLELLSQLKDARWHVFEPTPLSMCLIGSQVWWVVVGGDGWFELCSTVLTILTNLLHHNLDISKWNTLVVAADYKLEEIVSQHLKYKYKHIIPQVYWKPK